MHRMRRRHNQQYVFPCPLILTAYEDGQETEGECGQPVEITYEVFLDQGEPRVAIVGVGGTCPHVADAQDSEELACRAEEELRIVEQGAFWEEIDRRIDERRERDAHG